MGSGWIGWVRELPLSRVQMGESDFATKTDPLPQPIQSHFGSPQNLKHFSSLTLSLL